MPWFLPRHIQSVCLAFFQEKVNKYIFEYQHFMFFSLMKRTKNQGWFEMPKNWQPSLDKLNSSLRSSNSTLSICYPTANFLNGISKMPIFKGKFGIAYVCFVNDWYSTIKGLALFVFALRKWDWSDAKDRSASDPDVKSGERFWPWAGSKSHF